MQIKVIDYTGRMVGVNKKYMNRSYTLTNEYRSFKIILAFHTKEKYKGEVLLGDIALHLKQKTSKDIDAVIKPVLDVLQDAGVYENDSQIKNLFVTKEKIKSTDAERLEVWVEVL